jgi:hypothetical protein
MDKQDFITLLSHALSSSIATDKVPLELLESILIQQINVVQKGILFVDDVTRNTRRRGEREDEEGWIRIGQEILFIILNTKYL